MDICIQTVAGPMVFSIVKGHRDSNEVPAGKITSPLCLDRHIAISKQVSRSQLEQPHLQQASNIQKNGAYLFLNPDEFFFSQ